MPHQPSGGIDRAWAEAFSKAIQSKECRPTGEGWKTRAELQREWDAGPARVNRATKALLKNGTLEVFKGYLWGANKKPHPQRWYRPVSLRSKPSSTAAPTASSSRPRR